MAIIISHKAAKERNFPPAFRANRGATMVEMALIIAVLLMLTLGFVDILRYFAVRGALIRGAQGALTLATQIDGFDQDVRLDTGTPDMGLDCSQPNLTASYMSRVRCARVNIVKEATRIPYAFLVDPPNTPGSHSQLTGYYNYSVYNGPAGWQTWNEGPTEGAGVIRPGEFACGDGENSAIGGCGGGSPAYICHPSLVPPVAQCGAPGPGQTAMDLYTGWNSVLQQNPILVLLRAQMDPVIPWPLLGQQWLVAASAVGFREPPRSYKILPDMGIPIRPVIPTPTGIPTPVPTPQQCLCCYARDYASNCVGGCTICTCAQAVNFPC